MAKKDYSALADAIIEKVGGKANISFATHCMTRLRLNLKDRALANVDEIKNIPGLLGAQWSGDQFQIIVGQDVPKLYAEVCSKTGMAVQEAVNENLDGPKEKLTLKKIGNDALSGLSGCLTPIIPALMVSGMLKMVVAVFGDMLGIISAESDVYRLLTFVGDAGFYFFPVMIGYTGAKKFGCSPILGILMGGVLLHPTLIEIAAAGEAFTVFGIPMTLATYSSTVIPMVLITWVMSYVEKFMKKYIPDMLSTVFVPLLTIVVMLPLSLCLLAPLGAILASGVGTALIAVADFAGPVGYALIAALWMPLVATGMHVPLLMTAILSFSEFGYDAILLPVTMSGVYVMLAMDLAFAIRATTAENRSLGLSCLVAQALGGVGEPGLFGIYFRYKKAILWNTIGCLVGGFLVGLLGAKSYVMNISANIFIMLGYGQDIVKGAIACAAGFLVTFVLCMAFGIEGTTKEKD